MSGYRRHDKSAKLLPFPRWMIRSSIDLCPGFYNHRNYKDTIPTDGVESRFADLFALNIANQENREENGQITEQTLYSRTMALINYYGYGVK